MTPSTAVGSPQPAPKVQPGGPDIPMSSTTSVLAEHPPQRLAPQAVNKYTLIAGDVIKGKSAIHLARTHHERKRNFTGQPFCPRGYFVSTVGRDEATIRAYIQHQEREHQRLDQLRPWS
jgi:putative transposase